MENKRQKIKVQYPKLDHTEAVANIGIDKTFVNQETGVTIEDAFTSKYNSLFIIIENHGDNSFLQVKAGNAYPNSMLGDLKIELPHGTSAIHLEDLSRFEKADGSIDLDFRSDFLGTIYAIARWNGVR